MNDLSPIGHNNPPDPIDIWQSEHDETLTEAGNWLDGDPIETEDQMKAVDALIKEMRTVGTSLAAHKKDATAPLHDVWKAEVARWKPTEEDVDRIRKGLVALVAPIKAKIAEEKEAAKHAAYAAARKAEQEAAALARAAEETDLDAQREAAAAQQAVIDAKKAAQAASKDTVKGLRTVQKYEVTDLRALVNWIAANDKAAMGAFAEAYAQKSHQTTAMDGVRSWSEKEAY